MNSSGNILYQQADATVNEVAVTMTALQNAIEKQEAEKEQLRKQPTDNNSNSNSNAGQSDMVVATHHRHTSSAAEVAVVEHEERRFNIVEARKTLVTTLRSKIINPLVAKSSSGNKQQQNQQQQQLPRDPLLFVHQLVTNLLAKDSDLAEELASENPIAPSDDQQQQNTTECGRGSLSLRSLVPVAWCVRVAYAEAARVAIRDYQREKARRESAASSTSTMASTSVDSPLAASGSRTVHSLLRKLPCWKQVGEQLGKSVSEFLVQELEDLV